MPVPDLGIGGQLWLRLKDQSSEAQGAREEGGDLRMAASMGHRNPLRARTYSPGQHLLSPNDDASERARVRAAARTAVLRRNLVTADARTQSSQEESNLLDDEAIAGLLDSCLRLAAENKINQHNTWELPLIDHLSDVFKNNHDLDAQCNFQKASCGLEAGIKIYSTRVDSVHSQAFKVLGGLSRNSTSEKEDDAIENPDDTAEGDKGTAQRSKESSYKKGETTLAASFESLNLKRFDVAFAVDPLFHLTSAKFDEGGAKGLLLNTLSVYRECDIVFDSLDVPEAKMKAGASQEPAKQATIDLSSIKDVISQMMRDMGEWRVLSPSLGELLSGLDDPVRRAAEASKSDADASFSVDCDGPVRDGASSSSSSSCGEVLHQSPYQDDPDVIFSVGDDGFFPAALSPASGSFHEGDEGHVSEEDDWMIDDDGTLEWIVGRNGVQGKSNSWAGPDHWKFRKGEQGASSVLEKKKKGRKEVEPSEVKAEVDVSRFEAPKDPNDTVKRYNLRASTLAQRSSRRSITLLPQDCHYQALHLVQLFLRPVVCTEKRARQRKTGGAHNHNVVGLASASTVGEIWEQADAAACSPADETDDVSVGDVEDGEMLPPPRQQQVQKRVVGYEKRWSQVDVQQLKQSMWSQVQLQKEEGAGKACFKAVLERISQETQVKDVSVALCLICLLHLANEQGLCVSSSPGLDQVSIW